MSDIVERLRDAMPECCYPAELAADEIERLRAEVAKVRGELNAWFNKALALQNESKGLRAELAECKAEVKRLDNVDHNSDLWAEENRRLLELLRELRKVVHSSYAQKIDAALGGEKKDEA